MARKKHYPTMAELAAPVDEDQTPAPAAPKAPEPVIDPLPSIDYPADFETSYKLVLAHEGGFVNHPNDPGGATNLGISLRYAKTRGLLFDLDGDGDVDADDMREVTLETAAPAYFTDFWQAARCDKLPPGVSHAVFDGAVNSGPGRAARWLQEAVGATVDGSIGPQTLAAVEASVAEVGLEVVSDRVNSIRMSYLQRLPTWSSFGRGWRARVERVNGESHAISLGLPL